jgi:periplasmic protein TonB
VIDAVELSPVPEPTAPEAGEAEPTSVAEPAEALSPEPLPATAGPPPPPDTAEADAPAEVIDAKAPPRAAEAEPPPEPLAASEPELAPKEAPPEQAVVAALPPPPPPSPPVHAVAPTPRRPVPRAANPGRLVAEAPAAAAPATAAPAAPAPAMQRPPANYVGALLAALERYKEYPAGARLRQAEGVAMLRFTLRRDGAVFAWRIERSAGDRELDAAVERMIRRASPLPAPPPEMPGEALEMVVPVRFALR